MDNLKRRQNRRDIPSIRIDTAIKRQSNISITSSEESIPVDAPLVRQSRCSVDIDTISSDVIDGVSNGTDRHSSTYLDNPELRESILDIT